MLEVHFLDDPHNDPRPILSPLLKSGCNLRKIGAGTRLDGHGARNTDCGWFVEAGSWNLEVSQNRGAGGQDSFFALPPQPPVFGMWRAGQGSVAETKRDPRWRASEPLSKFPSADCSQLYSGAL